MKTKTEILRRLFVAGCITWTIISAVTITLCIIGTIHMYCFPPRLQASPEEQAIESLIQKYNGKYTLTGNPGTKARFRHISTVRFENSCIDDTDIIKLKSLRYLNEVQLSNTKVTYCGLAEICMFPSVGRIECNGYTFSIVSDVFERYMEIKKQCRELILNHGGCPSPEVFRGISTILRVTKKSNDDGKVSDALSDVSQTSEEKDPESKK